MAENSKIEWTHHTFNPWMGCQKVSPGCQHCYAETLMDHRYGKVTWGPGGTRVVTSESNWRKPLKWDREAAAGGERKRVFCASLADVFEDRPELVEPRGRLFGLIESTPNLDWLLLTKRPENIKPMIRDALDSGLDSGEPHILEAVEFAELFPNVWIGTSVENQATANERIPHLLRVPAAVRFLSCEPLLGPVDLHGAFYRPRIGPDDTYKRPHSAPVDWVIAGGESGPHARPMHPDWARSLRDQCQEAGVAFHFKQWGEHVRGDQVPHTGYWESVEYIDDALTYKVGKKKAGRQLDGREWNGLPDPICIGAG